MSEGAFEYLEPRLDRLRDEAAIRSLVPRAQAGMHLIDPNGRALVHFGSNDYLGFAAQAATSLLSVEHFGQPLTCGAGASALISGYTLHHQRLTELLADWEQTEAAVLFPSGYAACSGTVATLAEAGDLLLSDALNHASLIDGCRLSRADRLVFPHGDTTAVRDLLKSRRHRFARAWIVTEGVFGMDGDIAPLAELCDIAEQYDAQVIVDEAHGTGVLGEDGSGACSHAGVKDRVAVRIGTLSKALGSHGGFVVGPRVVIDYLVNRCRPLIFSTASTPVAVVAAIEHVKVARADASRRDRVRRHAVWVREALIRANLGQTLVNGDRHTPIVPLVLRRNDLTLQTAQRLRDSGFFVPAIRPPTVPEGTARLRISLSAAHCEAELESLVSSLRAILV